MVDVRGVYPRSQQPLVLVLGFPMRVREVLVLGPNSREAFGVVWVVVWGRARWGGCLGGVRREGRRWCNVWGDNGGV